LSYLRGGRGVGVVVAFARGVVGGGAPRRGLLLWRGDFTVAVLKRADNVR